MQQLGDHARREIANDRASRAVETRETRQRPLELRLANRIGARVQSRDGRCDTAPAPPFHVALGFLLDDRLGLSEIARAIRRGA